MKEVPGEDLAAYFEEIKRVNADNMILRQALEVAQPIICHFTCEVVGSRGPDANERTKRHSNLCIEVKTALGED